MERTIIGCGYLGRRVARYCLEAGGTVTGVVRSAAGMQALADAGIPARQADLDRPPLPRLPVRDSLLFYFAPPPRTGEEDPRVAALLQAFSAQGSPRRVVYLSTTGVYGDCGGEWVDEQRPVAPVVPRARRRWDAEQRFRAWHAAGGGELVILRVAGIYGPGRLPLERLRKGLPMVRESEAPFSNRIHVDDLARVCIAAMARGEDGAVYNASDGHPTTMTDYFNRLADRSGLPRPPLISLDEGEALLSPGMLSYMRESRRLDNRRLLEELGVRLRYPDLARGLDACFEDRQRQNEA